VSANSGTKKPTHTHTPAHTIWISDVKHTLNPHEYNPHPSTPPSLFRGEGADEGDEEGGDGKEEAGAEGVPRGHRRRVPRGRRAVPRGAPGGRGEAASLHKIVTKHPKRG